SGTCQVGQFFSFVRLKPAPARPGVCWGSARGSLAMIDVDCRMICAYVMNTMAPGGGGPIAWEAGRAGVRLRERLSTVLDSLSVIQPPTRVGFPTPDTGK